MLCGGIHCLIVGVASCAPPSHPALAEVFYDAIGDDSGHEFVEILNRGTTSVSLAGARLEVGDGSGPGRWTLRWTGTPGDSVGPGRRFVVGGMAVVPRPQSIATLDLQNGPDAVRLVWPDGASEVLGYGAHDFAEYFCGAPAADVPSGQSLARVPDDANLGGNALDFRAAAPSPGSANRPERDAAWVAGSLAIDPGQPDPGGAARLSGAWTNGGAVTIETMRLVVTTAGPFGVVSLLDTALAGAMAAGDTATFEVELTALPEGRQTFTCVLVLDGDQVAANDRDSLTLRVGPGPLDISEIQFHPQHAEGEWVEVRNRSGGPLDLAGFTLSDRGRARGRLPAGGPALAAESLAVLAQNRGALLARFPGLDSTRVIGVSPWSSLNNANDTTGVADVVTLRESDETPCARQPYSASGIPSGVPIERTSEGEWRAALDPDGSPLRPPRALAPLAGRFRLMPRRVREGAAAVRLAWSLPWNRARASIDVYDLSGARVVRAVPENLVSGRAEREWSIQSLAPGLYVVVLRARAESGGESLSESRTLRVDGATP